MKAADLMPNRRLLRALACAALVLTPPVAGAGPAHAAVKPEVRIKIGETRVFQDQTSVPHGLMTGLNPAACAGRSTPVLAPQARLSCHSYPVVIDEPEEVIASRSLQLNVTLEFEEGTRIPNCQLGIVGVPECSTNTMGIQIWQDPPLEEKTVGTEKVYVDPPVLGYLEEDDTAGVCPIIEDMPENPYLLCKPAGDQISTARASAGTSDLFGSTTSPVALALVDAGKCAEHYSTELPESGVCPLLYVNLANMMGDNPYRLTLELIDLSAERPVDLSDDPELGEPPIPDSGFSGTLAPPFASGGGPARPAGGGDRAPVPAPDRLPLAGLPGLGGPEGALDRIGTGSALGDGELAAAIGQRGRPPLPPPGDPNPALLLLWTVGLPLAVLGGAAVLVARRRRAAVPVAAGEV